ncbi:MAG: hypothetical protein F4152_02590 [Dehalococcoidia bacterium]|nr:hypothetical protein [Dehalococcoidia bacterium]
MFENRLSTAASRSSMRRRNGRTCSSTVTFRPPTSDFRPPTSDFRPPTSDLRPPTSDLSPPTSDLRSTTSEWRLATAAARLPTDRFSAWNCSSVTGTPRCVKQL